jgi:hypothetical protein
MTLHVISENTCSVPLDMTYHSDVQLTFHPDMAYYSSEYLLRSFRHAFLFQEIFSHVLIIRTKDMHYSSTLF